MKSWGIWRLSSGDGTFALDGHQRWRVGPAASRDRDLVVPGARHVTLAELVGHALRIPYDDAELARAAWKDPDVAIGAGPFAPGWFVSREFATRTPELSWVTGRPVIQHRSSGHQWLRVRPDEWLARQREIVGLRTALLATGFDRMLAQAQLAVLSETRERQRSSTKRAAFVAHTCDVLGVSRGKVATWLDLSVRRIDQLVDAGRPAPLQSDLPVSRSAAYQVVSASHADVCRRQASLREAQLVRRRRVGVASADEAMGLGEIARAMGLSRSQAQQLRNAARSVAASR